MSLIGLLVQMGEIEPLLADLRLGLCKHVERHTVAVLPTNARAGVALARPNEATR